MIFGQNQPNSSKQNVCFCKICNICH